MTKQYSNIDSAEVQLLSQDILKLFTKDPEWQHYSVIDISTKAEVGAINNRDGKIIILFRGALGDAENMSCIKAGHKEIHQGFFEGYQNIHDALFTGIQQYMQINNTTFATQEFIIAGHSRGTALVPQAVDNLIKQGVTEKNILAICFSPLAVYDQRLQEQYNKRDVTHINFLAKEDCIGAWVTSLQKAYSIITSFRSPPQYYTVGTTITYSAEQFEEFRTFAKNNPYIHLDPKAKWIVQASISNIQWCAHMPECYALTAHKASPTESS